MLTGSAAAHAMAGLRALAAVVLLLWGLESASTRRSTHQARVDQLVRTVAARYGIKSTGSGAIARRLIRQALLARDSEAAASLRRHQRGGLMRFQSPFSLSALDSGVDYVPVGGDWPNDGTMEPTPQCRRMMNGWMAGCVFGKAEESFLQAAARRVRNDVPGLDGFEKPAGLETATPECTKAMNGWMSTCIFSHAVRHEAVDEKPQKPPPPSPAASPSASPAASASPSPSKSPLSSASPSSSKPPPSPSPSSSPPAAEAEPKDCLCHMVKTLGRRMKEGLKMGAKACDRKMCAIHALGMAKDSRERRSACIEVCKKKLKGPVEQNCKTIACP